ncbi:MAG TPA: PRC and DUF2382 domain-containing protein [Solirubrobacteraceae bacterium]|nr:PRC and DUF2382 domain-containing protein [Solirubrobacteraceae bacterium]
MQTAHDLHNWPGETLYDRDGSKIGEIVEIYADRGTGEPAWLAVKTGLFGSNISFVPLHEAARSEDGIRVPYDKSHVKDSPNVPADAEVSPEEERRLWEHYSMEFGDFDYDQDNETGTVGHDTSGPTTDQAMTRSEEELRVGTAPVQTGRARLRKYVTTEHVQTSVPVQREEVRIEREPITDANIGAATDGPSISEEEHEVTLYAEEPVIEKRVVPQERVRLDKETVTEERAVSEEVRKEHIEAEGGR